MFFFLSRAVSVSVSLCVCLCVPLRHRHIFRLSPRLTGSLTYTIFTPLIRHRSATLLCLDFLHIGGIEKKKYEKKDLEKMLLKIKYLLELLASRRIHLQFLQTRQ